MALPASNSVAMTTYAPIDGLVQGGSWTFPSGPRVVTYQFTINDEALPGTGPNGGTWQQSPWIQAAVDLAFNQWSNVANIGFTSLGIGGHYGESIADIAITLTGDDLVTQLGELGAAVVSLGIFPDPEFAAEFSAIAQASGVAYPNPAGDLFFDNYWPAYQSNYIVPGGAGFLYILHEIGHALGLKHPFDNGSPLSPRPTFAELGIAQLDTAALTLMGRGALNAPGFGGGNPATPMPLDIQAVQRIYGANMSYRTGDDSYALQDNGVVRTIWDAGGVDSLDLSGIDNGLSTTIDLRPGGMSTHGLNSRTAIAFGTTIENALGSRKADTINGNDANNRLDGGTGFEATTYIDTLIGHGGDDTYIVDSTADIVVEAPNEGIDLVFTNVNLALPENVENLAMTSSGSQNATGNQLANVISGNEASNRLAGGAGDDRLLAAGGLDVLEGNEGDDQLDGGGGYDRMYGGPGNDTYSVDGTYAASVPATSIDFEVSGTNDGPPETQFADESQGSFEAYGVDGNSDGAVDRLVFIYTPPGFVGRGWNIEIATPNYAPFSPGSYSGASWTGDPTIPMLRVVGGGSAFYTYAGSFTIHTAEFARITTPNPYFFEGSVLQIDFDSPGTIYGGYARGTIVVNLFGAQAGDSDLVAELPDEGMDTVVTASHYALTDHVENLTLTGTEHVDATGNAAANVLTGNSGHNVLTGSGGNDELYGGEGYDTARFSGSSNQYAFVDYLGTIRIADRVRDRDGVDTTHDVERARFAADNADAVFTASDVFTPLEYIASYTDLIAGFGANAALGYAHLIETGRFDFRAASFDALEYLASHPDLLAGMGMDDIAAATHYIQSGRAEGRTVTFNGLEYIASYTDLMEGFSVNEDAGTLHYLSAGQVAGRTVTFRGIEYLASNLDLMAGFGADFELATAHYIASGRFEGRSASFHALEYIASYADLMDGLGTDISAGALHYINSGRMEGRTSSFRALEYIASYPDLIVGIGANLDAGAAHYIKHGRFEDRTEHFDVAQYLANYPDLAAGFGQNHTLAAIHYIEFGYAEGRTDLSP